MACTRKCQRGGVNREERWMSLHKWWARMAPGVPTARTQRASAWSCHQHRNIPHVHKRKKNISVESKPPIFRWHFLFHSSEVFFFYLVPHLVPVGVTGGAGDEAREGGQTSSHTYVQSLVVPFLPLHHFFFPESLAAKHNICRDEEASK